ncbi:MAG: TnpV protein, partial [Synergistaceae bacterium]|nr:TnpV protein [Synergistaceae bacterium]
MQSRNTELTAQEYSDPSGWREMNAGGWMDSGSLTDGAAILELAANPSTGRMTDPETGLEYIRAGDYWVPALPLPETEPAGQSGQMPPMGKYARMRLDHLEKNGRNLLAEMRSRGRLTDHLENIEETANRRIELIMTELLKKSPPPDKSANQMGWVRHMNMT